MINALIWFTDSPVRFTIHWFVYLSHQIVDLIYRFTDSSRLLPSALASCWLSGVCIFWGQQQTEVNRTGQPWGTWGLPVLYSAADEGVQLQAPEFCSERRGGDSVKGMCVCVRILPVIFSPGAVDKLRVSLQHRTHSHDEAASLHHVRDHTVQVRYNQRHVSWKSHVCHSPASLSAGHVIEKNP